MLRFVVVLTYAMARTKKFTLHLDGCDKALQDDDIHQDHDDDVAGDDVDEAAARHVGRAWHAGERRGWGREVGRSATINVTICDLCLAPAWLTLWYLEFLSERILFAAEIAASP